MSKHWVGAVAVALMMALMFAAAMPAMAELYPLSGLVIDVDHWEDCITVADFYGHTWVWEDGAEDWDEGDLVAMIMDDNGTPSVLDDTIWEIQYQGGWR